MIIKNTINKKRLIPFLLSTMLVLSACHSQTEPNISAEFPYASHYTQVNNHRMHYVDEGKGPVVLFLHGNPTSSYLWRNIIPHVAKNHRAIAVDLIGMGKSDKPDLKYDYHTHYRYLESFIKKLNLKDVTLVLHDWGSGLGFHYFDEHPENVTAIAFMEALTRPMSWADASPMEQMIFKKFRDPLEGKKMLIDDNMFLTTMLPMMTERELTPQELAKYNEPYLEPSDRQPVFMWPAQIPFDGKPARVHQIIQSYRKRLANSKIPKLLFWVTPGAIIKGEPEVKRIQSEMSNLETVFLGKGRHYVQESYPRKIGTHLAAWLKKVNRSLK